MMKAIVQTDKIGLRVTVLMVLVVFYVYGWQVAEVAQAQEAIVKTPLPQPEPMVEAMEPARTEIVSGRNENTRLWEIAKWEQVIDPVTHEPNMVEAKSYIYEKGCGICYKDNGGKWQVTDTMWRQTADGFVMDKASYKLEMGATAGSTLHYWINGTYLLIKAHSLAIDDGTNVDTFASVDGNVFGAIDTVKPNKLTFADAFGVGIDLVIEALPDGYHQDVVFRKKPLALSSRNIENAKVLLYTEMDLAAYASQAGTNVALRSEDTLDVNDTKNSTSKQTAGRLAVSTVDISRITETKPTRTDIQFIVNKDADDEFVSHWLAESEILAADTGSLIPQTIDIAEKQFVKDLDSGKIYLVESLDAQVLKNASYPLTWDYRMRSGTITADEDWYANSTYYVSSSITLDPNVTLRIEPATIVKFGMNTSLDARSGTLIAKGAPYSCIVFTSARDSYMGESIDSNTVSNHDWSGIRIKQNSQFEFCKLGRNKNTGLELTCDQAGDIDIKNNIFYDCNNVQLKVCTETGAEGTIRVFNNLFISGLQPLRIITNTEDANVIVVNNTISCESYSTTYGIHITDSTNTFCTEIKNNLLSYLSTGIYCGPNSVSFEDRNAFYSCTTRVSGISQGAHDVTLTSSPFHATQIELGKRFLTKGTSTDNLLKNGGDGMVSDYYDDPNAWSIYAVSDSNHYFSSSQTFTTR